MTKHDEGIFYQGGGGPPSLIGLMHSESVKRLILIPYFKRAEVIDFIFNDIIFDGYGTTASFYSFKLLPNLESMNSDYITPSYLLV